jgi:hypothetical protein
VHPVPKSILEICLPLVPEKYLHGLGSIELRARNGPIGLPFGRYTPGDRQIWLYSLPLEWRVAEIGEGVAASLTKYGAEVSKSEGGYVVTWPEPARALMGLWFFNTVVGHELGHHFNNQYKSRRTPIRGLDYQELHATLHGDRIARSFFAAWRAAREGSDSE